MGSLFKCKFCKEDIVDSNYVDNRRPPVFDEIYHKDCDELRKKHLLECKHKSTTIIGVRFTDKVEMRFFPCYCKIDEIKFQKTKEVERS